MYCPNCGKEIDNSSRFCRFCGAQLENKTISTSNVPKKKKVYYHSYPIPTMVKGDLHDRSEEFYFEKRPNILCFCFGIWFLCLMLLILSFYLISLTSSISPLVLTLLFGIFFLIIVSIIQWKHTIYALTTNRVLRISGVIGKNVYENKLNRVQDVRLRIGILQRILGCGDITITTAGTAGVECVWNGIKEPKKIQEMLRKLTD